MAMMSMAAVLTGCGDDDDNDDDNPGPSGGQTNIAPATVEELTAANKIYTVTVPGDTNQIVLTFPGGGQYRIEQGATVETGAFANATRSGNTWTLNVTPAANQDGAQPGVVSLDFSSGTEGTWTFTPDGRTPETGTFVVTTSTGNGDNGGDDGGGTGALSGQTLLLTGTTTEEFDFLDDTNVAYENGAVTGTYTWDEANRNLDVTLSNGWLFDIDLPAGSNIATVSFRESELAEPEVTNPTYTLGTTP
jgi:hypothetical protein